MNKKLFTVSQVMMMVAFLLAFFSGVIMLIQYQKYEFNFFFVLKMIVSLSAIIVGVIGLIKKNEEDYKVLKFSTGLIVFIAISIVFEAISSLYYTMTQLFVAIAGLATLFVGIIAVLNKKKEMIVKLTSITIVFLIITVLANSFTSLINGGGYYYAPFLRFLDIFTKILFFTSIILVEIPLIKYLKEMKKGSTYSSQTSSSSSTSSSTSSSSSQSNDLKVNKIKEYQEKYGLTLMEAKELVDAEEKQAQAKQVQTAPINTPKTANDFEKQAMADARANTPTSIQSSGSEVADLKRQLLQGKITRAEFDEKMAELKK